MEPIDLEGVFWQADKPDHQVAGRLAYKPMEGSVLSLLGSFDDLTEAFSYGHQVAARRIVGLAGGKQVTLDGCIVQNVRYDGTGLLRQAYYVPVVLEGAHFSADEVLEFDSLTVGLDQLPSWLGQRPFNLEITSEDPNDLSSASKFTLTCDIPRGTSRVGDGLSAELSFTTSANGDRYVDMTIARQPRITLKYERRQPFSEILIDFNGLQDLVTLAVDVPTVPTSIQLARSDLTLKMTSGRTLNVPIDAYWYNVAEHVRHPKLAANVFVGFDQAGGLGAVAKWVAVSRKYREVVGRLLTIQYTQRLAEETRLANVVGAAETFHRINNLRFPNEVMPAVDYRSYRRKLVRTVRTQIGSKAANWLNGQLVYSNEPRLRQRLTGLAEYAGTGFASLVGNVESWVRVVTWLRNRLTHHDPSRQLRRLMPDIHNMTDSVFILVMLVLLRECDFPEDTFINLTRLPRIAVLQSNLAEIVPRLEAQTRS